MAWRTLSLHFKQTYDGAYRYLDRCGEFIMAAVEKMDFMPGEVKPTGAKLEIPEHGLTATVDSLDLVVVQEIPEEGENVFFSNCLGLSQLANEHFTPTKVVRNGFAVKSYWPITSVDTLLATSLRFGEPSHEPLAKLLGMVPAHRRLDCTFSSGSMDLHVLLHPVTFERVSINRQNASFQATSAQKHRVERFNKFADRFNVHLSHALLLELDLTEVDPPAGSMTKHFNELQLYTKKLREHFTPE
jgi:hypothetical protein